MSALRILKDSCPALAGLDERELQDIVAGSSVLDIAATDALFRTGDRADSTFVVLDGTLVTLVTRDWGEERVLEEAGPGDLVGTVEIVSGDRRLADVRAMVDSRVLEIPRLVFEKLLGSREEVWRRVSGRARTSICRILTSRQLSRLLGTSGLRISDPLLRLQAEQDWLDFERDILEDLEKNIDWLTLQRGEYLFRQGDKAEDALVLVSGVLQVSIREASGVEKVVAEVGPGEIVGEVALFTDQDRTASLVAMRDSELFRIPRRVVTRITERYPQILLSLYRSSFQRLVRHSSVDTFRPRSPNTALLRAHADVDMGAFLRDLLAAMASHGSLGHLTSASVDESLGQPGITASGRDEASEVRLVQWLNGQERQFDRLVYEADAEWTAWTDRCVRQADHVLVVADAADGRELPSFADRSAAAGQRWSLVVLHPPGTDRPRETARRLDEAGLDSVYHVRRDNGRDLARLARILSGRAVGLVLGGGGARGMAHLGLLRALEELGIDVDMVGGTSMGAPLAGWVAQGRTAAQTRQAATTTFASLLDPTFPVTSLLAGRKITRAIETETGSWDIEDFWLPFFCVSTNLTTASAKVHRRGSSVRAIRSSISIPGILPPVPEGDDLLVDGCVLNNLPIDVMRDLNPSGLVIASDVVAPRGLAAKMDYGLSVSGWRQAFQKLTPWRRRLKTPAVGVVILQSTMVGSEQARRRVLDGHLADYYQNIHVPGLGMLQFDAVEKASSVGYEAAVGPLREWAAAGFPSGVVVGT